jgi:hypothetical protein
LFSAPLQKILIIHQFASPFCVQPESISSFAIHNATDDIEKEMMMPLRKGKTAEKLREKKTPHEI